MLRLLTPDARGSSRAIWAISHRGVRGGGRRSIRTKPLALTWQAAISRTFFAASVPNRHKRGFHEPWDVDAMVAAEGSIVQLEQFSQDSLTRSALRRR